MNVSQIEQTLKEIYARPLSEGKNRHVVFWYDAQGDFVEEIDAVRLNTVKILKLTDANAFLTKYKIEKEDVSSNILVYSNLPKPMPRQNWLIDILKYSIEFSTDKSSLLMRDLGISDESLRTVIKKYSKFFNSQERLSRFRSYAIQEWSERNIHLAVLATLCKTDYIHFDEIVKKLLIEELNEQNKYWQAIEKFGDVKVFWELVESFYGRCEYKTLNELITSFCITHLHDLFTGTLPNEWKHYVLNRNTNGLVFINQFMHHSKDKQFYNEWAKLIQNEVKVDKYLPQWNSEDFIHCDTFPIFDDHFIKTITNHVSELVQDYTYYRKILTIRKKLHWFDQFEYEYEALNAAISCLEQFNESKQSLRETTKIALYEKYANQFYLLDQAYRQFFIAYDQAKEQEYLHDIKKLIEDTYGNGYLDQLSVHWSNAVMQDKTWPIPGIKQQQNFFDEFVHPHLKREERVFVIISDALRFEAANELVDQLNQMSKASTNLEAMQGVIPSYTTLGMASLLPHQSIEFVANEVKVDGQSTKSLQDREKILKRNESEAIAVSYTEIKDMKRKMRDLFKGKKLIYIYHNTIDARGDHSSTEHEVFFAVRDALNEIKTMIFDLVNNVSATNVYVTADHGFIYQRGALAAYDKTQLVNVTSELEKRRFIITKDQAKLNESTMSIPLNYLDQNSDLMAIVPRGTMRYAKKGAGANFVHGGAMLQEIVVPVLTFKNDRSSSDKNAVKLVNVQLTNISRKITSKITYLEFFQMEKVTIKRLPLRLTAYFVNEAGERVSNENILLAESSSDQPQERTFKEKFVLKSLSYDKTKSYYLILEDEIQQSLYEKIPFVFDLTESELY